MAVNRADEVFGRYSASAPLSVRAIKQAAFASLDMTLEQAFHTRFPREEIRMHSQDAREGPRAFAERRAPVWQGR